MTQHIVLETSEMNKLVWVCDKSANLGEHTNVDIEKVKYLPKHHAACSAWGDFAFIVRDKFVEWIEAGNLESDPELTVASLRGFVGYFLDHIQPTLSTPPRSAPGLILVTFFDGHPRIYSCLMNKFAIASPSENLWAGDNNNPAGIFIDYYYRRTQRTIEDALTLGIHSLRIAHELKAAYIGEPNAWVYRDGDFARLAPSQMARYVEMSKSLDASILAIRTIP